MFDNETISIPEILALSTPAIKSIFKTLSVMFTLKVFTMATSLPVAA